VLSKFRTKEEAMAHVARGLPVRCHVSGELLDGECLGFFDGDSDEDMELLRQTFAADGS